MTKDLDFYDARDVIWNEIKKFSDEVNAKPQYWKLIDYHTSNAQWGALSMVEEPDNLNILYPKPDGYKFNHIEQYKILRRFKELMGVNFLRYYKRKEEI